jgi:hypothetical protein
MGESSEEEEEPEPVPLTLAEAPPSVVNQDLPISAVMPDLLKVGFVLYS